VHGTWSTLGEGGWAVKKDKGRGRGGVVSYRIAKMQAQIVGKRGVGSGEWH